MGLISMLRICILSIVRHTHYLKWLADGGHQRGQFFSFEWEESNPESYSFDWALITHKKGPWVGCGNPQVTWHSSFSAFSREHRFSVLDHASFPGHVRAEPLNASLLGLPADSFLLHLSQNHAGQATALVLAAPSRSVLPTSPLCARHQHRDSGLFASVWKNPECFHNTSVRLAPVKVPWLLKMGPLYFIAFFYLFMFSFFLQVW